MALTKYTNTYNDIDGATADSADVIAEFDRLETFLASWMDSIVSGDLTRVTRKTVDLTGDTDVYPNGGLIQQLFVASGVANVNLNFQDRVEGDPFRIYICMRFRDPSTTFTVSGPSGATHIFGLNTSTYQPSQVLADGYYTAMVVATYGSANGCMLQVFADNSESTTVGSEDILTVVAK